MPSADDVPVASIEVEVGSVTCDAGDHVTVEPYFFPPHHIEDMVLAAKVRPFKRCVSYHLHWSHILTLQCFVLAM